MECIKVITLNSLEQLNMYEKELDKLLKKEQKQNREAEAKKKLQSDKRVQQWIVHIEDQKKKFKKGLQVQQTPLREELNSLNLKLNRTQSTTERLQIVAAIKRIFTTISAEEGLFEAQQQKLTKCLTPLREWYFVQKDPTQIEKVVQSMKYLYWENLGTKSFPTLPGYSIIFIGRRNVGKSSLLNALFGLKLATSKISCTKQICEATIFQGKRIFDCPGFETYFDLLKKPEASPLSVCSMQVVCYLYNIMVEEDIVRTLVSMKKTIIGVRTHCDPDENDQSENDSIRAKDIDVFKQFGAINVPVFLTSSKGGQDNNKFLEHIQSLQA